MVCSFSALSPALLWGASESPPQAAAIRTQNVDAPAGRIGQPPAPTGQAFQFPLDTLGRLAGPEQFDGIIVKASGSPQILSAGGRLIEQARAAKPKPRVVKLLSADATSDPTTPPTVDDIVAVAPATGVAPSDSSADAGTDPTSDPASSGNPTTASMPTPSSSGASAALTSTGPTAGGTVGSGALGGGALESGGPSPATGLVRLQDVARIELGAQNYNTICSFDGRPSVGLGLYQLPGTNALDVGDRVRERMQELKAGFPDGVDYQIAYDTTPYIRDSVRDVIHTLLEAIGLVAIVVLVFLQDWRAMILPMIDVPVSLIGTLAVMSQMGLILYIMTLFGLVLAIGIVVDDAIVVLENIERQMATGLDARTATIKAMEEITGPVLAITLVLSAVFIPCCFLGGITGSFFRQFAVTIACPRSSRR
ncbi:Efflux pump membrane transporter BepE [Gemmata sp. SH-PL17]|uniref:efflux RND transporter permease subunit n=1 Tax=Gemmata sp. SH-PL17 TaxID=1630693 RepID=UPI00078B556E|nr:efflux RND transporter permease subunit [Gemmata sp. SH-PL17]AMV26194.1 Efflux pump membrane transporter BepE [Gemmata sp. SH-PL17]